MDKCHGFPVRTNGGACIIACTGCEDLRAASIRRKDEDTGVGAVSFTDVNFLAIAGPIQNIRLTVGGFC